MSEDGRVDLCRYCHTRPAGVPTCGAERCNEAHAVNLMHRIATFHDTAADTAPTPLIAASNRDAAARVRAHADELDPPVTVIVCGPEEFPDDDTFRAALHTVTEEKP